MKKVLVFPTWVVIGLLRPFLPATHPWKNKRFTLTDWAANSTPLNDTFAYCFWATFFYIVGLVLLVIGIYSNTINF